MQSQIQLRICKKQSLKNIVDRHNPEILFHYAAINGTEYFYDIPTKVFNDNIAP